MEKKKETSFLTPELSAFLGDWADPDTCIAQAYANDLADDVVTLMAIREHSCLGTLSDEDKALLVETAANIAALSRDLKKVFESIYL